MIRIKYESNLNICIKYKKLNCSELILAGLSVFLKCFFSLHFCFFEGVEIVAYQSIANHRILYEFCGNKYFHGMYNRYICSIFSCCTYIPSLLLPYSFYVDPQSVLQFINPFKCAFKYLASHSSNSRSLFNQPKMLELL